MEVYSRSVSIRFLALLLCPLSGFIPKLRVSHATRNAPKQIASTCRSSCQFCTLRVRKNHLLGRKKNKVGKSLNSEVSVLEWRNHILKCFQKYACRGRFRTKCPKQMKSPLWPRSTAPRFP